MGWITWYKAEKEECNYNICKTHFSNEFNAGSLT